MIKAISYVLVPSVAFTSYNDEKVMKRNSCLNLPALLGTQIPKIYSMKAVCLVGGSENNTDEHFIVWPKMQIISVSLVSFAATQSHVTLQVPKRPGQIFVQR